MRVTSLAVTIVHAFLHGCDTRAPAPDKPSPVTKPAALDAPLARTVSADAPAPRNLAGSHTTRSSAPCTTFVHPDGSDRGSGHSLAEALRTPTHAMDGAAPGNVVCFARGHYPPLVIEDRRGTAAAPIVFRTLPGDEHAATFASGSLHRGGALTVLRSAHVHLYDLALMDSNTGIDVASSTHTRIEGLLIENVGQAAVHIGRSASSGVDKRFQGPPSHDVDLLGNTIRGTGKVQPRYGEGVYVGTGGLAGDDTHGILVAYNTIEHTGAEGIEVKAYTYDVTVRGNTVAHGSHYFHAAITVGVTPRRCVNEGATGAACTAVSDYPDGHYLVEDNRVFDFASSAAPPGIAYGGRVAGIGIGHGNTIVRNNVVGDIPGGNGIRTYTTFGNPSARRVRIENNVLWNLGPRAISLHDGDEGTGVTDQPADVSLVGNVTLEGDAPTHAPPPP